MTKNLIINNPDNADVNKTQQAVDEPSDRYKANRRLVVLAGPTAVGKGTVEQQLFKEHPDVWLSVSATTRAPRPGEIDGVNYHFITEDQFAAMKAAGGFLETALVHGMAHYGTPVAPVKEHLAKNQPSMLEIDLQGTRLVRKRAQELNIDATFVFLAPPSFEELKKRLIGRGTETPEQRAKRLETAKVELQSESEFDIVIVNDDVQTAAHQLWNVIDHGNIND